MPNWCENNLSIYGKKEEMKKLMEVITIGEDEYSLLEKLYPTPDELNIGDVSMNPDEQQIANFEKFGYKSCRRKLLSTLRVANGLFGIIVSVW